MANNAFDRTIINPRERPLSSDMNQLQSQLDRTGRLIQRLAHSRRTAMDSLTTNAARGFYGNSFIVTEAAPAGMSVYIASGLGFIFDGGDLVSSIGGIVGLDDLDAYKPVYLPSSIEVAVPAADPGNPRIDIIQVRPYRRADNPLARDTFDPATELFAGGLVNKTLDWALGAAQVSWSVTAPPALYIDYKQGTAAPVPVEPAVDAGFTKIARINVDAAAGAIHQHDIVDCRRLLWPGGVCSFGANWQQNAGAPVSLMEVAAPPGVRMCVVTDPVVAPEVEAGVLYVFAGDAPAYSAASFSVTTVGTYKSVTLLDPQYGTVSAADKVTLDDAAKAYPVLDIAVGTPFVYFSFHLWQQNGGTKAMEDNAAAAKVSCVGTLMHAYTY